MNNLSLILLTHNESAELKLWQKWIDKITTINEIIVVDDNSTDDSLAQAKKLESKTRKVNIFTRSLGNNFSAQRQFAISKASNDLILWLDPDETPTPKLIEFLNNIDNCQYKVVAFKRVDSFLNHDLHHGENYANNFIRLFNKRSGTMIGSVHENWQTSDDVYRSQLEILHQPHSNLTEFYSKINFYSDIRAQELFDNKVRVGLFEIIFYPLAKFIDIYFIKFGFLDGTPGIIMALGMSFHSFLVRGKLWCLYNP